MRPSSYKPAQLVQAQTTLEWLYAYDHCVKVWPSAWGEPDSGYVLVPDDFEPELINQELNKCEIRFRVQI